MRRGTVSDTPGGLATLLRMATTTERGYTATKDQLLKRLKRVEGQVRGVRRWSTRTATASTC